MPAFPNNVPVVKALAGCTLLAGTRRWDCAGIPEAEGISRGSPSLRPAHHHPGPSQLDPNPGKELPRQDEMIIVIIVINIITIIISIRGQPTTLLGQLEERTPANHLVIFPNDNKRSSMSSCQLLDINLIIGSFIIDHLGPSTLPFSKEPDVSRDCIHQYFKVVDKVVQYVQLSIGPPELRETYEIHNKKSRHDKLGVNQKTVKSDLQKNSVKKVSNARFFTEFISLHTGV